MNVAVIIAGGCGQRMGSDIPKQFLTVLDKPVIVYTLESFQKHPMIDWIEIVCIDGWQDKLKEYLAEYHLDKVRQIVPGGASAQESIRNGVDGLKPFCSDSDIVVIHDGIRPLVDDEVLTDAVETCKRFGNAVSSLPYNEQIFVVDEQDGECTNRYIPRETLRRVMTPQAYRYGELAASYQKAFADGIGIGPSSYTNTMMADLGVTLHFSKGSDRNIKLTNKNDLNIFKGYLLAEQNDMLE